MPSINMLNVTCKPYMLSVVPPENGFDNIIFLKRLIQWKRNRRKTERWMAVPILIKSYSLLFAEKYLLRNMTTYT